MAPHAPIPPAASAKALDEDSRRWLDGLRSGGPDGADAVEALFDLLRRGARREAERRRGSLPEHVLADLDDLARQAADLAVAAVLRKLPEYRGDSRFTTWAYKFVIFEMSAALRREAWRGRRTVDIDDDAWRRLADSRAIDPAAKTELRELVSTIERCVATELTPWQREVFISVVVLGVPIDVLAHRHDKARGAVYKVLHDARRKLRAFLHAEGWDAGRAGEPT
jgi:RNA polymerase sigma-70 factor (ECF subfamily)